MDTKSILQKVNQKYYSGSTQPQTPQSSQRFEAPMSKEIVNKDTLTSKVVNQIQKDPSSRKDILTTLEQASSKVMKPVSEFFFGATGRTIGGLLSAGVGNIMQFSKNEKTKETGERLEEIGSSQFTPTNIGFTALELMPGGGALKNTVKGGLEKVGFKAGVEIIEKGSELLAKTGDKIKGGVKNAILNVGSRLTSVGKDVLERWGEYATKTPEKLQKVKDYIVKNEKQPMQALVNDVAENITRIKNEAQTMFTSAKEAAREVYKDTTFNLSNKLSEFNKTLQKFNLKATQVIDDATGMKKITINPTTRTSPFSAKQISDIENVVGKLGLEDLNVDELTDFVDLSKSLKEAAFQEAERTGNKKLVPLTMELFENSSKFVDEVLPEMKEANDMYRKYYKIMDDFGGKIVDSSGKVNQGAESFLSNALNANKGEQRRLVEQAAGDLGIDILGGAEMLKDATKMVQSIPNSVRNRMVDFLIAGGLTAAGTGIGAASGGGEGAGYGAATGLAGAGILYALSNPSRYGRIIEWLAKKETSDPPLQELRALWNELGVRVPSRLVPNSVMEPRGDQNFDYGMFDSVNSTPSDSGFSLDL